MRAAKLDVLSLIDHTHPATAELLDDAVVRDGFGRAYGEALHPRGGNVRVDVVGKSTAAIYASAVISDLLNCGHSWISWMGNVTMGTRDVLVRTRESYWPRVSRSDESGWTF